MKRMIRRLCLILCISGYSFLFPQEKPLVVVVCSYNNSKWTNNTLDSIFSQEYTNFRLIIVDDCSSDSNQSVIQKYIDDYNLADRVTFIKNDKRYRKLFNLYRVLYMCDDDEIVVMLDGDDSFAHSQVLARLSRMYDNEEVWFTYGQYRNVPVSEATLWGHKEMGYCRPIPRHIQAKQAYRYYSFIYMHPRSFRAWLFKLVKLEDLIADKIKGFEGDFYPASNDVAMYFPMVEMAHTHIRFISDILYIRNLYSELVGFKVDRRMQVASAREIRKKECYPVLFKPKKNRLGSVKDAKADMFIICKYSLFGIENRLENIQKTVKGLEQVHIFFLGTLENKALCRKIKRQFPSFLFIPYYLEGSKTFKNRFLDFLSCTTNNHVVVMTDSFEIITPIDITEFIYWLEKTYAHRFYLNRHASQKEVPRYLCFDKTVCAWKMFTNTDAWRGMADVEDMFLCNKQSLLQELKKLSFDTSYSFIKEMHKVDPLVSKVGLFCNEQKIRFNG